MGSVENEETVMDCGRLALDLATHVGLPVKVEIAGLWAPVVSIRETPTCVLLTLAVDWDPKLSKEVSSDRP